MLFGNKIPMPEVHGEWKSVPIMKQGISIQQIIQAVEEAKFSARVTKRPFDYSNDIVEEWHTLIDSSLFIQALQKLEKGEGV